MITFIIYVSLLIILAIILLVIIERAIAMHRGNNLLTENIKTLLEIAEKACTSMIQTTESFKGVLEKQNNLISKILEDYSKKNN